MTFNNTNQDCFKTIHGLSSKVNAIRLHLYFSAQRQFNLSRSETGPRPPTTRPDKKYILKNFMDCGTIKKIWAFFWHLVPSPLARQKSFYKAPPLNNILFTIITFILQHPPPARQNFCRNFYFDARGPPTGHHNAPPTS